MIFVCNATQYTVVLSWVMFNAVQYDDLALKYCPNGSNGSNGSNGLNSTNGFTTTDQNNWSIHGWWPEYSRTKWPQFCDPKRYSEFNANAIAPIRSKLELYWGTCPGYPPAYQLWKHEWQKHGTCVVDVSVVDYFNHTINAFLRAKHNNFYGCCADPIDSIDLIDSIDGKNGDTCLIPFALPLNETKWLGYCH